MVSVANNKMYQEIVQIISSISTLSIKEKLEM